MTSETARRIAIPVAAIAAICIALSLLWDVPYILTLAGLSAWAFFGHLITADDDLPGGWSNLDGKRPFPWRSLGLKALVLVVLGVIALVFPEVRNLGGSP